MELELCMDDLFFSVVVFLLPPCFCAVLRSVSVTFDILVLGGFTQSHVIPVKLRLVNK